MSEQKGTKYDQDKPQLTLVPKEALDGMARAFMYGAKKYNRFNYKNGLEFSRLMDAAMRHILAFNEGENLDPESSENHISHALASLAMLMYNIENHPELDDRYKKGETNSSINNQTVNKIQRALKELSIEYADVIRESLTNEQRTSDFNAKLEEVGINVQIEKNSDNNDDDKYCGAV